MLKTRTPANSSVILNCLWTAQDAARATKRSQHTGQSIRAGPREKLPTATSGNVGWICKMQSPSCIAVSIFVADGMSSKKPRRHVGCLHACGVGHSQISSSRHEAHIGGPVLPRRVVSLAMLITPI